MILWLALMFIGLVVLGAVFYKVWTATEAGIDKRWLAAAFAGTLVSILGLVMTLRTAQKEPSQFIPQATLQKNENQLQNQLALPMPLTPSVTPQTGAGKPTGPLDAQAEIAESGIPKYDPNKYPEESGGETFTKEDIQFFVTQTNTILNKLEAEVTQDLKGEDENPVAKANRWYLYNLDHTLLVANLRTKSTYKRGPGTGYVRQIVHQIGENLLKMERVYHNAAVRNEDLDLNYISYLRESTEKLIKKLESEEH